MKAHMLLVVQLQKVKEGVKLFGGIGNLHKDSHRYGSFHGPGLDVAEEIYAFSHFSP